MVRMFVRIDRAQVGTTFGVQKWTDGWMDGWKSRRDANEHHFHLHIKLHADKDIKLHEDKDSKLDEGTASWMGTTLPATLASCNELPPEWATADVSLKLA
eukprot:scaffold41681_cov15-Tisochrysis_lutea.AAC.1